MIGLACAYVFVMDWHLGATLAAVLAFGAVISARRSLLRFDATTARHREGDEAEGVFAALEQRIPALRAHGTGPYERDRVREALALSHRPVRLREYRLALAEAASAAVLMLAPLSVLALGAWFSQVRPLQLGHGRCLRARRGTCPPTAPAKWCSGIGSPCGRGRC